VKRQLRLSRETVASCQSGVLHSIVNFHGFCPDTVRDASVHTSCTPTRLGQTKCFTAGNLVIRS